jgi:tetratricopeptide (TPR) repeat protein
MFTLFQEEDRVDFESQAENLIRQGLLSEALIMAEERKRNNPSDVEAHAVICKVLIRMGEIDKARNMIKQVDQAISGLSLVYARMADICKENGLNSESAHCYRKFMNLNPIAGQSAEIAEKISFLEKAQTIAQDGNNSGRENVPLPVMSTMTMADLYEKQGHLQASKDILSEIIIREPNNINAAIRLDHVKTSMSNTKAAVSGHQDTEFLINTLTGWLANIDRLSAHATAK